MKLKVQANTTEGIYEVKTFDDTTEILDAAFFEKLLDSLDPNEEIGAEIDIKTTRRLDTLYGIRLLSD